MKKYTYRNKNIYENIIMNQCISWMQYCKKSISLLIIFVFIAYSLKVCTNSLFFTHVRKSTWHTKFI